MKKVYYLIVAFLLLGCAVIPELKPEASSVRVVTSHEQVKNCESLGMVYGYSDNEFKGYAGAGGISQRHSVYDAQNKTYAKGGNIFLIVNTSPRTGGTDTVGEAYLCKENGHISTINCL